MKLNLDILPFGHSELDVDETVRLELDGEDGRDLRLAGALSVDNTDGRVLVTGVLRARVGAECDRCLEGFDLDYPADLELQIVRAGRRGERDENDGDEGVWVIHQSQGEVDLRETFREAALLAWPHKTLCDDDCRGLCAVCGANRNRTSCDCETETTDPRWDALPT